MAVYKLLQVHYQSLPPQLGIALVPQRKHFGLFPVTLKINFLSAVKNLVLLRQRKNKNLKIRIGSEQWLWKPIRHCRDAAKLQTLLELHVDWKNMTRNMVTNVMISKYLSHSLTRRGFFSNKYLIEKLRSVNLTLTLAEDLHKDQGRKIDFIIPNLISKLKVLIF